MVFGIWARNPENLFFPEISFRGLGCSPWLRNSWFLSFPAHCLRPMLRSSFTNNSQSLRKIVAHCPTLCIDGAWLNTLHNIAMPTDFINALCSPRSFRLHRLSNAQMTTPSRGFCCASYHKKRVGRCGGQIFTMFFLFFLALFCV